MFFQQKPFAIDISDHSIEVVSLGGSLSRPRLLAMGRKVLDPGVFISGSILGKENLVKSLQELLANLKFGKLRAKKIISALPESKSYLHILELPASLNQKDREEYIRAQAKENFPYSLDELCFDYRLQNNKGILAASPKRIVQDYLEVFRACGLELLVLETESLSLGRSLAVENVKESVLIADLGARTTNFNLFSKGELRFSFSLNRAGSNFTEAVAKGLGLPLGSAENLKKEIGLDPQYQEGRLFLVLQKELQSLLEELRKITAYFQEKTGETLQKVVLAGGSSALPGLSEYLAENLDLPVEIGDPWVRINIDILKKKEYLREALEVNPILYSTVLGGALRGLAKNPGKNGINLLPRSSS